MPIDTHSSSCLPIDEKAEGLKTFAVLLATSTWERFVEARARMDVPMVAESEVQIIQDESVCQEAVTGYNKAIGGKPNTQRSVHVVRIGPTRYAVVDSDVSAGGREVHGARRELSEGVYVLGLRGYG